MVNEEYSLLNQPHHQHKNKSHYQKYWPSTCRKSNLSYSTANFLSEHWWFQNNALLSIKYTILTVCTRIILNCTVYHCKWWNITLSFLFVKCYGCVTRAYQRSISTTHFGPGWSHLTVYLYNLMWMRLFW